MEQKPDRLTKSLVTRVYGVYDDTRKSIPHITRFISLSGVNVSICTSPRLNILCTSSVYFCMYVSEQQFAWSSSRTRTSTAFNRFVTRTQRRHVGYIYMPMMSFLLLSTLCLTSVSISIDRQRTGAVSCRALDASPS